MVTAGIVEGTSINYPTKTVEQIGTELNLSTPAKRALDSGTVSGTGKEQTMVLNELKNKGVFDRGLGNENYFTAKPDVKREMPSFLSAQDSFETAKAIIEKHRKAGDLDELL